MVEEVGEVRPRRRANVGAAVVVALTVLVVLGGAALLYLGREDPRDAATVHLAWGDRAERRLDAYIDRVRPAWADRVEARLDGLLDRIGWN
jgi:hypothetical protein